MSVLSDKPSIAENALAFAVWDGFPVSPGHALVLPRREVSDWFELSAEEQAGVWALVGEVRVLAAARAEAEVGRAPDGWNLGVNVGAAGGQTVWHVHVHVIPRFSGDMDDPRGGVRHVIPWRGNYRRDTPTAPSAAMNQPTSDRTRPLTTGEADATLDDFLGELFSTSDRVTIVAAFTQDSGLDLLEPRFKAALRRGACIRLVTGDYLHITQAHALSRLLDLQREAQAFITSDDLEEDTSYSGRFEARVVEAAKVRRSFHPKAWLFIRDTKPVEGVAYVGSSNISRSALVHGVEWNLRLERAIDPDAFDTVADAAEVLWSKARPLDEAWVAGYRERAKRAALPFPPGEEEDEAAPPPAPRDVQTEALKALASSRQEGRTRALVVLATGLGKTFLAAFDVQQFAEECGRPVRVLLLAHRKELLTQAATTFRRVLPDLRITWCVGAARDTSGDLVLASVQKLARPERLAELAADQFDYVIVDEVHHAAASTYRRILQHLTPKFLLGLTATPERADEADVLGLFDDHLPYRADVGEGIRRKLLVPFAYEGLRDTADYSATSIPWRNGRFDPAALARAVQTERRMTTLWAAWQRLPGTRNLIFCLHALAFVRHSCCNSATSEVRRQESAQPTKGSLQSVTTKDRDCQRQH